MENFPDWLNAMPQLGPGLIIGALAGIGYAFYLDWKADEDIPHSWWQYGSVGAMLGALAWMALLELS